MLALGAASVGALLAGLLRQSLVLGYIVAGLAIGPFTPGIVVDVAAVEDLADIGVVLLMFAIGVQLSFSDLLKVGPVALIGGNIQVLLTIAVGFGIGLLVGWGWLESLFFGAVLSNSSSTVLSKVLGERGEEASLHGRISLGWSSVQDFGTVVLVVLLTTLSEGSGSKLAVEVAKAVGLAVLFLVIVIPIGLVVLPRFFERVAALGSTELFVLMAAGVALSIAFLASAFGVSVALGAFVGGILVGRSDLSHRVLQEIRPLRDIFAGLFFVSVGMLIDPGIILSEIGLVVLAIAVIIIFKGALSSAITLAFGYRGRTALLTGAALAQCAEFSFLMASVGSDIGAISSEAFGVMLGASAISIVLAPATLSVARPIGAAVERRLPLPPMAVVPDEVPIVRRRNHAIICGYGRVGRVIAATLRRQQIDFVVIEQDGGAVEDLRARGVLALQGSASNAVILERAGLAEARLLVVAVPDPISARQIVVLARETSPGIDIVVRTHSQTERRVLEERGANEAVVGELELALEMSRHALERFGIDAEAAAALLQEARTQDGARAPAPS